MEEREEGSQEKGEACESLLALTQQHPCLGTREQIDGCLNQQLLKAPFLGDTRTEAFQKGISKSQ